jgi:small subunit ribosomal protein S9
MVVKTRTTKNKGKIVSVTGTRRRAIARAVAIKGEGSVLVNSKPLSSFPEIPRLFMSEPLVIGKAIADGLDIKITVNGGGMMGQADAARQAIAKSLVGFSKTLKNKFLDYDRTMLVADYRRTEPHKPSRSKQGPRVHKQRSKR